MHCADVHETGPGELALCFELTKWLCCFLAKQHRPALVCQTKHIFGRSDIYGIADLAYEGLDRRTLAPKALYNFLAFHHGEGRAEKPLGILYLWAGDWLRPS